MVGTRATTCRVVGFASELAPPCVCASFALVVGVSEGDWTIEQSGSMMKRAVWFLDGIAWGVVIRWDDAIIAMDRRLKRDRVAMMDNADANR